jgi:predicted secreted Zn-dependent protease
MLLRILLLLVLGAEQVSVASAAPASHVPNEGAQSALLDCASSQCEKAQQLLQRFDSTRVEFLYFPIYGLSHAALAESLRMRGPRDAQGLARDAAFLWYLSWHWPGQGQDARLAEAQTDYRATLTVPVWQDYSRASPELQAHWDKYFLAVVQHEFGHYQILLKNIDRPAQAIRALVSRNQKASEQEAQAVAQGALEHLRALDRTYDRETQHGVRDGVQIAGEAAYSPPG